ncbi:hypothetical protein [Streptomyces malaysiensis]|uniref:Uncharacterized protein n=1 Tax=Streptomyces malaysiensis TaxID=92644 RepID=A0A7X6AZ18_STRMQ|nr:hypothetical protein [Streptomyces malaysiensis]NIY67568.1 hypothetical protein [Streptomyces malaysiensis]
MAAHPGTRRHEKRGHRGQRAAFADASSRAVRAAARVDRVLHAVLDTVDVLAIGNEPFIESLPRDRRSGALNRFYETVAEHIVAYRKKHFPSRCRTRLYMGAFNHLDKPDGRTAATDRWLSFTRRTQEIEGVDIHPHVSGLNSSAGVGGPPVSLYAVNAGWTVREFVPNAQFYGIVVNAFSVAANGVPRLNTSLWTLALAGMAAGAFIGRALATRVPERGARLLVLLLALAGGLSTLAKGAWEL